MLGVNNFLPAPSILLSVPKSTSPPITYYHRFLIQDAKRCLPLNRLISYLIPKSKGAEFGGDGDMGGGPLD